EDPERVSTIKRYLSDYIKNPSKYLETMKRRIPRQMRLFSIPTSTTLFTDVAGGYSVLEVISPDRPGLLARIGKIFYDFNIHLQTAKITTLGERVEDIFYITDKNQIPINDAALCEAIQTAICKELDEQATSS
ncbi:MAG: ACT domain-containing protein, partial [Spongiibacteraceae bacterium]|nr:ACT domain-containing protein [Spongiibacteraceae bacterium]